MHKITATLYNNLFNTGATQNYVAQTEPDLSLSVADVCRIAINRGGHSATPETMRYHVEAFLKELIYQLLDNNAVHTDSFRLQLNIKDTCSSPHARFEHTDQYLTVDFQPTKALWEQLEDVEVMLYLPHVEYSNIDTITDISTGTNNQITPQGTVAVTGHHPDNGAYFKNINTGETIKVTDIVRTTRKNLLFLAPDLPAGDYQFFIVSQDAGGGKPLKAPRRTMYNQLIPVIPHSPSYNTL
ncbi:MAG: DUF4469 domain-containing protein [Prevotellaceae bacterium]|jgi:hypothetical protein|nr:DUF4469 domain-containing protein [Prevotellaceae bacterium]